MPMGVQWHAQGLVRSSPRCCRSAPRPPEYEEVRVPLCIRRQTQDLMTRSVKPSPGLVGVRAALHVVRRPVLRAQGRCGLLLPRILPLRGRAQPSHSWRARLAGSSARR